MKNGHKKECIGKESLLLLSSSLLNFSLHSFSWEIFTYPGI
jgi:hypothetical protein